MLRRTLTILSPIGLLLSAVAWVAQARSPIVFYHTNVPASLRAHLSARICMFSKEWWVESPPVDARSVPGFAGMMITHGDPIGPTKTVTRSIGYAAIRDGRFDVRFGTETLITDRTNNDYVEFGRWFSSVYRVPLWSIALGCALAGGLLTVLPAFRRRKRNKVGLCAKCGSDLRPSSSGEGSLW